MPDESQRALAGRLVVGLNGSWPSESEERWLEFWRPCGVILFSRNVSGPGQLTALCAHLHNLVPGLEIMADHEGGPVSQLFGAVGRPPSAWSLGVLDDPDLTRRVHAETGRRCRHLGIDRLLAPCADVMTEIHNPVIGSRAFGASADLVSRHVASATKGLTEACLKTCLKHWPGHGGSLLDSHISASRVGKEVSEDPFLSGLAAGAESVMVGHLWPADQGNLDLPASLDAPMLKRDRVKLASVADKKLSFFADDVTMGALRPAMALLDGLPDATKSVGMVDPGDLSFSWLETMAGAGCDFLLIRGIPWRAFPGQCHASNVNNNSELPNHLHSFTCEDDFSAEAQVYFEARCRIWENADLGGFASKDWDLIWFDFTIGDRWEVAFSREKEADSSLLPYLLEDFKKVYSIDGRSGEITNEPLSGVRLLITSHRPLTVENVGLTRVFEQLSKFFPACGWALVMGHPSLANDVRQMLGPDWNVSALFDTTVKDYVGPDGE